MGCGSSAPAGVPDPGTAPRGGGGGGAPTASGARAAGAPKGPGIADTPERILEALKSGDKEVKAAKDAEAALKKQARAFFFFRSGPGSTRNGPRGALTARRAGRGTGPGCAEAVTATSPSTQSGRAAVLGRRKRIGILNASHCLPFHPPPHHR